MVTKPNDWVLRLVPALITLLDLWLLLRLERLLWPQDPERPALSPWIFYGCVLVAAFSTALMEAGVYVGAVRFPVVPRGEARLRAQPSAAHSPADIDEALAAFRNIGGRLGLI